MPTDKSASDSLRARLDYEPVPLKFGTSGRRGWVVDLTQLEVYVNALAEVQYLQALPAAQGGLTRGEEFYFACDLRPSSTCFVAHEQGRGEIAQAVAAAIADAGMKPVFLGPLPTPALAAFAFARRRGSIMVTGSHIPFERNGYKTNTAQGELLKQDEAPIQARVERVRALLYAQPFTESAFSARGLFEDGHRPLPPVETAAPEAYLRRYTGFFGPRSLAGKRVLVYQHSAVGGDLLVEVLRQLGAETIPAGRSESFVPIDTENIDDAQLRLLASLAADAWLSHGPLDALVSTDGDSDRPLVLGVDPAPGEGPGRVCFFGGDLVGMVVARFLGADAVVVPITCNDAVDRGPLKDVLEPKTRIGSPHVIAGMEHARAKGRQAVCGWEANGGFLTGSDITCRGKRLPALPTRDAFLPILAVLACAAERNLSLSALFAELPARFSRAALLKNFPRAASCRILNRFSPPDPLVTDVVFATDATLLLDDQGRAVPATPAASTALLRLRDQLARCFSPALGFGAIQRLNYIDGVRVAFDNGDIAHFRPSGNADELRIYAVADTPARADAIVKSGIAEPGGILRQLEKAAL